MYTIYLAFSPVPLRALRNLKKLGYNSGLPEVLLRYAVVQLQAITSASGLLEVTLHGFSDPKDKVLCRALDGILSGSVFPSLRSVFIPTRSLFHLFPKLYSVGLLKATRDDRRKEYV